MTGGVVFLKSVGRQRRHGCRLHALLQSEWRRQSKVRTAVGLVQSPCGTPHSNLCGVDILPPKATDCNLSVRNELSHLGACPLTPNDTSRRWSTVSKATLIPRLAQQCHLLTVSGVNDLQERRFSRVTLTVSRLQWKHQTVFCKMWPDLVSDYNTMWQTDGRTNRHDNTGTY